MNEIEIKRKKSRKLNNSFRFDFHLFLEESEIMEFFLYFKKETKLKRINKSKYLKAISVLFANLINANNNRKFLAISFNKNSYVNSKKENPNEIRWDILKNILLFLIEKEYLIYHRGFINGKNRKLSRIKFNELFFKEQLIKDNAEIKFNKKTYPFLILKNKNKKMIKYENTLLTERRKKVLVDFNKVLDDNYITYKNKFIKTTPIYRIFNNDSFKLGGRFYGGDFQRMPKEVRKLLRINGREVVELDYSCLHISIIYDKEKIKYNEDAYEIGYKTEHSRKIIKFILITMLNSSSRKDAESAVRYDFNKKNQKININISKVIDLLIEKHHLIKDYFFNKKNGLELQYKESLLAEHIIRTFIYSIKPKVVLPIHDGFICDKRYEEKLRRAMIHAYKKYIGDYNCKITIV